MVYTVTFNPALDYALITDKITIGETNRSREEYILTGGKGINVSTMLSNLGVENTALGFIGGFTGQEIKNRVINSGCNADFIEVNGLSRINVKLKSDCETEINGSGPEITDKDIALLIEKIENIKDGDYLVLAGSIPKNLPNSIYSDIMKCTPNGVKIVVDATGELLTNALKQKPFLIKPNNFELSEIVGEKLTDNHEDILKHAGVMQKMGAENVLVSLAGSGAVLISSDKISYSLNAPYGKVLDSVGAGDSMVAGFLCGYIESGDYQHAFKMGIASGSASAFSKGFATKENVMSIYNTL